MHLSYDSEILNIYANYVKTDVHKNTCSWMWIAFWFETAKQNQRELETTQASLIEGINKV